MMTRLMYLVLHPLVLHRLLVLILHTDSLGLSWPWLMLNPLRLYHAHPMKRHRATLCLPYVCRRYWRPAVCLPSITSIGVSMGAAWHQRYAATFATYATSSASPLLSPLLHHMVLLLPLVNILLLLVKMVLLFLLLLLLPLLILPVLCMHGPPLLLLLLLLLLSLYVGYLLLTTFRPLHQSLLTKCLLSTYSAGVRRALSVDDRSSLLSMPPAKTENPVSSSSLVRFR